MSLSLARKYRPRDFASVAVQSHVSNTMRNAIARGRVAPAYLLCGPRGVGKTTLARVLAMALNCENKRADGEPCGECASCQRIWSGSASLDVVEIDAASNRGVDDARELRERAMYAPSGDERYKVYIVDEAHMLTREAWNALLKILEEPPPRVVFVFATTEPHKIQQAAAPVLSRVQRFDFKRIGPSDVRARLQTVLAAEHIDADPDALGLIARAADGSMRDALSLTDQALSMGEGRLDATRVREALGLVSEDEFIALLDIIARHDAAAVFGAVARLVDFGADLEQFLGGLADTLRATLAATLGGEMPEVSDRMRAAIAERKEAFSSADLLRMLNLLGEMEPRFKRSGQQQMLLETMLVRFALLDRSVDVESLLRELGPSGSAVPSQSPSRIASPAPAPSPARNAAPSANPASPPPSDWRAALRDAEPRGGAQSRARVDAPAPSRNAAPSGQPVAAPPPRKVEQILDSDGFPVEDEMPFDSPGTPAGSGVVTAAAPARQKAPRYTPTPANVDAPPAGTVVSVNLLAEQWDAITAKIRESGKATLAAALEHALPVAASVQGAVLIELGEANEIHEQAFEAGRGDVLAAIQGLFPGVQRVSLKSAAGQGPVKRMTAESLRAERTEKLRKRDPVLDAAIEVLDLELKD